VTRSIKHGDRRRIREHVLLTLRQEERWNIGFEDGELLRSGSPAGDGVLDGLSAAVVDADIELRGDHPGRRKVQ
jgi:hypothetical protein